MRPQMGGAICLLLLGLAVQQCVGQCTGYDYALNSTTFDRFVFMLDIPQALVALGAKDGNPYDGNVLSLLPKLSSAITVNKSAISGGVGDLTYLRLTPDVDVAYNPMVELVTGNIDGPTPLGPLVLNGRESVVVYNPPQDLMNDIKAGFVQDDNDLLESYLSLYCDSSPVDIIHIGEAVPVAISNLSGLTELNPGLQPLLDVFDADTPPASSASTVYVRRIYYPLTFEDQFAGAAVATLNYNSSAEAVAGAQPQSASLALIAPAPAQAGGSLYPFGLKDADGAERFAIELQRLAGALQAALNDLASKPQTQSVSLPDPNTSCPPPPGASCPSTFFSLPKTYNGDQLYLLTYSDANVAAVASSFCQAKGFGGSGTVRKLEFPPHLAADQWRTFDSQTQQACQGATCVAVSVIECYPVGGAPLGPDGNGNVGCGNTGSGNTGSWNTGSNNHGSCNAGSNDIGDSNAGSNVIGSSNQASNMFGNNNAAWAW